VTVVAIGGDDLVAVLLGHLHADDDRFLADVEVAEAADEAHAVELARLFLEAADQQHLAIGVEFLFRREAAIGEIGLVTLLALAGLSRDIGRLDRHECFLQP
jgi:hypothetical protein